MTYMAGNNAEDRQLVENVLRSNKEAYAVIIKQTERIVLQIVYKMIPGTEDRRDIAQDVYLKAYKNLSSFRFQSKLSTWIAQICYNCCRDHLRKKKIQILDDPDPFYRGEREFKNARDLPGEDWLSRPGDRVSQKELALVLQNSMQGLSPLYRTLITLYHHEDMSYEEIGQVTGLPQGTVKSYLFRARKQLKESILLQHKKEDLC